MLDEKQEQAVRHREGPCMVLAGPGSGKTTVITGRVLFLVKEKAVPEEQLLVVTFTKAAAEEMKKRTLRLMGKRETAVSFGTLHAFFYRVLRTSLKEPPAVLGPEEQKSMLRGFLKKEGADGEDTEERIENAIQAISKAKRQQDAPKDLKIQALMQAYEEEKKRRHCIDFDDMAEKTRELFLEQPELLKAWHDRFRYLMVDEFQDIDPLQYEILKRLSKPENNLFIVGDDDQSIYGFRGADPKIMQRFTKDYPDAEIILLDVNYRCQKRITKASLRLISKNSFRFPKEIRSLRHEGEEPVFASFRDFREEHEAVVREIQKSLEKGNALSDHAVLYRTNQEPLILMDRLMRADIPFQTKDRIPNLYNHWICRDVFSYLELAEGSKERKHLLRIMNHPDRLLERELLDLDPFSFERILEKLEGRDAAEEAVRKLGKDLSFLKGKGPFAAITYLRFGMGYEAYLKKASLQRGLDPEAFSAALEELQEAARGMESFAAWKEHAHQYTEKLLDKANHGKDRVEAVTLSTLHGAKGLEFKTVFLIDAVSALMPYKKAVSPEEIEEERRLFYVGVTRAKERLFLYDVKSLHRHPVSPSPFLEEMKGNV